MPQLAPLSIGPISTPSGDVSFSLEPVGTKDGLTTYDGTITPEAGGGPLIMMVAGTSGVKAKALQPKLTVSISQPSKTSRISKVRVKLVVPVAVLDVNGVATNVKSHENSADTTYLFSEKSTEAERAELDAIFASLDSASPFPEVIRQLKSMY